MMLPASGPPATSWVHYTTNCKTQSSPREDGQNNCPKHVELTGIINKPLLLHLVGCLYYWYFIILFWDLLNSLNLTLILKTWRIWWAPNNACKWQTDLIRRLKVNNAPTAVGGRDAAYHKGLYRELRPLYSSAHSRVTTGIPLPTQLLPIPDDSV